MPGSGGSGAGGAAPGAGGSNAAGGNGGSAAGAGSGASGGADASGGASGGTGGGAPLDVFGIRQLYPSAASGAQWSSAHWDGQAYDITDRIDQNDPLGISGLRGEGTLEVTDGELVMGGSQPRIYIYPSNSGPWRDVEITAYYQRVEDAATAYAGLVIGTRSGEEGHTTGGECDAHTYYARVRNDGEFDFEKELEHPASATQSRVPAETAWPPNGQVPYDTWIGFKFVIYNGMDGGTVKLEAYRDLSNGANGGDWQLVNETVDDGGWFVESTCAEHSPNVDGESELIVLEGGTTMIRNTDVTEARYRWVSVREIAPF